MKYVSLHHHSTFSYQDGHGTPESHVAKAVELGMESLALTEHGNVSSHARLEKAANAAGIKPLFGCELYTAPADMRETGNMRKWHLTVLAEDTEGYRNLLRLVSKTWSDGFYRWPTASGAMLKEYSKGLIVMSGCADSLLACDLFGGKGRDFRKKADYDTAMRTVQKFADIFGDRYYIECQQFPELERTRKLNPVYAALSEDTGVPLVASSDCHYPEPDDNKIQTILHAAGRGNNTIAQQAEDWEYDIRMSPPTSDTAIYQRLRATGLSKRQAQAAIANTGEIAQRCNVVLPKVDRLRYPTPDNWTSGELIWEWLRRGWKYRAKHNPGLQKYKAEYLARIKREMELIESKDFVDYFLMLSDAVRWCKNRGIPVGPARGSAAASLVCYILRITEVDPIQFPNMLFERFIDVNRNDLPDVDLDFDDERRDELREHLSGQYGADNVGNIGTFTRYRGKNALVDVARVNAIPDYKIKVVKDLLVERSGGDSRFDASLEDTIAMFPQAKAVFDEFPELYDALRLEGNIRGMSVHAAGLVISNTRLTDTVALYERTTGTGKNTKTRKVLSVDKYDAEYLGLMKADFLGLSTMGMIRYAINHIGMSLEEMYNVPLDDEEVIARFRANDVTGIFQFGGGATRIVNGDVAPDSFMELADINALSRPGPLQSGQTQAYIDIKHGRRKLESIHPLYDEIVADTKGQVIYQEQVLRIVREIGDFPWTHASIIRKAISQKWGEAAMNVHEERFIEGAAKKHGIDKELAQYMWRRLVTSASYSFNIAHCVSYSLLGYWTMWLKVHYPQAFYAATLAKYPDERFFLLRDAIKHDVHVLPPDPNKSGIDWAIDGDYIRAGFAQVEGIAEAIATVIIADRDANGPFDGWGDLLRVKGIGPAKLEKIKSTAGSDDPFGIYAIDRKLAKVREAIESGELPLPTPTHDANDLTTETNTGNGARTVVFIGIPIKRDPRDVIEDERMSSGEDYETIRARLDQPDLNKRMTLHCIDGTDRVVYARFNRFHFPKFEKGLWALNLNSDVVVLRGLRRQGQGFTGTSIYVRDIWVIDPDDI